MIRHVFGGAGIVDETIEPAPLRRRFNDALAISVLGDIALHDDDLGAGLAAQVGGLVGFLLARRIVDDDAGAAAGKLACGRSAKAARRAGNQHDQTIHRHRVSLLLLLFPSASNKRSNSPNLLPAPMSWTPVAHAGAAVDGVAVIAPMDERNSAFA